jgi:hypothetical protein
MTAALEFAAFDGIAALPRSAADLLTACAAPGPYDRPAWFRLLADTVDFGAGSRAVFHVLYRGPQVLAVLPLLHQRGGRDLRSLANYYAALAMPALHPSLAAADVAAWLDHLRTARPAPARLLLAPLAPEHPAFACLREGLARSGWHVARQVCFANWVLQVTASWPEYWAARDGALRHTAERKRRRFDAAGGRIDIVCAAGAALEPAIQSYEAVYADSWKTAEPHPRFMPSLIRGAAEAGTLRLGVAVLDGVAIAAQVWLVHDRTAHVYKLAYRESHAPWAAGTLLSAALMRHVIEVDGVAEVDYGMGDEPYKRQWMSHRRERLGFEGFNARTWAGLAGLMRRHVSAVWHPGARPEWVPHVNA